MSFLTRNLGRDKYKTRPIRPEAIRRVLISRPNGRLGNQVLITPLLQEVSGLFPGCRIDLFVKGGVTHELFLNDPDIDRIIKLPKKPFRNLASYLRTWVALGSRRYNVAINAVEGSSSGRLSVFLARADYKFYNDPVEELRSAYSDYTHMGKNPVYNLRHALRQDGMAGLMDRPMPSLDIKLTREELRDGEKVLRDLTGNDRKTICIYTFATGGKCYPEAWWREIYGTLKSRYGADYNIVEVLPVENVSQIGFSAPTYYSKDLRQIAAAVAHAELFLLADCGIMHLASAAPASVIGLFAVTDIAKYQPYGRRNMAIDTRTAGVDDVMEAVGQVLSLPSPVDLKQACRMPVMST